MTLRVNGSCRFRFPVPDYEAAFPWLDSPPKWRLGSSEAGSGVEDGVWHCPHEAYGDRDRCLFHLDPEERPPTDLANVSVRLVEAVEAANAESDPVVSRRRCQFVGAKFPRLDLEQRQIGGGSRETIDFRHAEFGAVVCRKTEFEQPVDFSGATFDPGAAPPATPGSDVLDPALERVDFGIDFSRATFSDFLDLKSALFRRPALFREAQFDRSVSAGHARFLGHASFLAADFDDLAMFNDALFRRDARFQAARFFDLADFKRAYFGGRVSFDRVLCEGDLEVDEADFVEPPPNGPVQSTPAFRGSVSADMATVTGRLSFDRTVVGGDVRIRDAELSRLQFKSPDTGGATGYVDLARSTVTRGTLGQPDGGGKAVYDLFRTTLGDVKFTGDPDELLFTRLRLLRTRYDGFDFTDDDAIDLSRVDNWIHRFDVDPMAIPCYCGDGPEHAGRYIVDDAVCPRHDREADHSALQATYAYAKNGADAAGDNVTAGALFYREMRFHRAEYLDNALYGDSEAGVLGRLRDGSRWARSWLLAASTGYGELPYRVVVTSLALICGFGYLYWNRSGLAGELGPLEALTFSFQSFISFVLGPPGTTTLTQEITSAVEGFIGAFLIALFVFTFTRRIHR
ncbi:pentapeptide repeat-containing protein [Halorubrum distributum]|uniref:Pentapeptide repeat-containing protein n=1 Tax=Halorubrum distributum JCM 10247 TaxID=1227486 RepID=M0D8M9_9EURY|nr:pentapeptide repeat-containing protein [Halorubrum terrestre]ELZ31860.1 pentapeptide repeat-containing protein [Halorubrum terrestre JCM 10247]